MFAKPKISSSVKSRSKLSWKLLLEDPENQMLHFTEQDGTPLRNQEIAASFDTNFDTAAHEEKISGLMHRTCKRLGKGQSADRETWNAAIRELQKGDHHILVMWGGFSWLSFLILLAVGLFVLSVFAVFRWFTQKFPSPDPHVLQIVFCRLHLFCTLFCKQFAKVLDFLFESTVRQWFKSKGY